MSAFGYIAFAARTDIGRKRKNNEDAFGVFPESGIFCVADGMGGGDDGEVASAAVVKSLEKFAAFCSPPNGASYRIGDVVGGTCRAVSDASRWIFERAQGKHLKGCGSTFVGICFDASKPSVAVALHAGDSRLYRVRGGGIKQITKDHSAAELIGAKDENSVNPLFRGVILRAVGIKPSVDVERTEMQLKSADRIVICSDGLSKMVPDKSIARITASAATPDDAANALIDAANSAGGVDNVTVVVLFVAALPSPLPTIAMPDGSGPKTSDNATGRTDSGDDSSTNDTSSDADEPGIAEEDEEPTQMTLDQRQAMPDMSRPKPLIIGQSVRARRQDRRGRGGRLVMLSIAFFAALFFAAISCYVVAKRNERMSAKNVERMEQALQVKTDSAKVVNVDGKAQLEHEPEQAVDFAVAAAEQAKESVPERTDVYDARVMEKLAVACSQENADAFVRTVRKFRTGVAVHSLAMRFRPMRDGKESVERRMSVAVSLTEDVQDIARDMLKYADKRIAELKSGLSDHRTQSQYKADMSSELDRLESFVSAARPFVSAEPEKSDTQFSCADMILGIPRWFK